MQNVNPSPESWLSPLWHPETMRRDEKRGRGERWRETHLWTKRVKLKPLKDKSLPSLPTCPNNEPPGWGLSWDCWPGERQAAPLGTTAVPSERWNPAGFRGKEASSFGDGLRVASLKPGPNSICIYIISSFWFPPNIASSSPTHVHLARTLHYDDLII